MTRLGASVLGTAGVIAILTLLSRAVGFFRTVGESWVLGATPMADAYSSANNVPNILFELAAGGALAGVVVPVISSLMVRGSKEDVSRTASALMTWVMSVSVPLAIIVIVCAHPIAHALLGRTSTETVDMAAALLRVFALQIPLYGLSVPLTGVLQAHRKFVLPALTPLLSSLVVLVSFYAYWATGAARATHPDDVPGLSLAWLAWGTTAGVAFFALPQLIPVMRLVRLRPTWSFPDGVARRVLSLAGAGFLGLVAQQSAIIVTMVVANNAGGGVFPVYKYAQAMFFLPYAILAVPIATSLYPKISERSASGEGGLADLVGGSIRLMVAVSAAGGALLAAVAPHAETILTLVYDMTGVSETLTILAGGVLGYSLLYHLTRVFFATGHTRGSVVMVVCGWVSVILMALWASGTAHEVVTWLAWSMVVGMTVAAVLGIAMTGRLIGTHALSGLARTATVSLAAASIGGVGGRMLGDLVTRISGTTMVTALGGAILGALVALGIVAGATWLLDRSTWKVATWMT